MEVENKNNLKKEEKLKMNKIWIQQQNILPEGMLEKMNFQNKTIKNYVELLNEEEKTDKNKEKIYNSKKKDYKRSLSSNIIEGVSPKAKNILLKIGKHISKMKNSISDITKMNGLYLEQNARNTFRLEGNKTNKTLSKLNYKNVKLDNLLKDDNNSNRTYFPNKNHNNNVKNYLSDNDDIYGDKQKKEDYVKNFMYVNDNYRKQLNFAFLKYNPISHLENLKILVQADPFIRKDISKIKEEVEEDIKWKCDKFHFRKKYLNFISKNPRSLSVEPVPIPSSLSPKSPKPLKAKKIQKILPNIKNKNIKEKKIISPQHSKARTINFFEKIKNRENLKYTNQKEQKLEEINNMLSVTSEINNLISNENINDKIDLYKTDYDQKVYYSNSSRDEKQNSTSLLNKDYFLEDKKKVEDKIGNVFTFQITKNAKEKEKQLKGRIINENNKMHRRIIDGKKNILDEIYNYIDTNQIRLPIKQIK